MASPLERALVSLIDASPGLRPDQLGDAIAVAGELLGGREVVVVLGDLEQQVLRPITTGALTVPMEGSPAGAAFMGERAVVDGDRLWVAILDSAERIGVLGAVVDDTSSANVQSWATLAGLAGELIVAKTRYGDVLALARRTRAVSLAAELRWSLLPPLTFTSTDIVVAGMLEPAYDIAGDTFDYAINEGVAHVGLFDAMGHGLEACRMANLAVGTYQQSRRLGDGLLEMARRIDEVILDEFGDARFVTGQLATIELDSGRLTVANAGHPPPVVFHADGGHDVVPAEPAPPLGLGLGPRTMTSSQLCEGDVLLFHTDGITEARSVDGTHFGSERLYELVSELLAARLRPAEVIRQVVLAVIEHGRPLRDDATLALVGWRLGERALPPLVSS
jgi:hypothetical protein